MSNSAKKQADYIITGAGCAGLSLAMHMIRSGKLDDKKILLVDQQPKKTNDRTWCFWENGNGVFEDIVFNSWDHLWFYGEGQKLQLTLVPFRYKMIRGIDFYQYCLKELGARENVQVIFEKVDRVYSNEEATGVVINGESYDCDYLFNSILFEQPRMKENEYWMLQHFKGWMIETENEAFDPSIATLMDFRTSQENGTAFCYVLPFSKSRALIEYTLFSHELLQPNQYDNGLKEYIKNYVTSGNYKMIEEEFGVIPMTNHQFETGRHQLVNIGTAGGQTKGSSGYTFHFIQQHSRAIVNALISTGKPSIHSVSKRFHFYDSVLLNILHHKTLPGEKIFTQLFQKNRTDSVLRFLHNESSLKEELRIISTLPVRPFTKAALQQMF